MRKQIIAASLMCAMAFSAAWAAPAAEEAEDPALAAVKRSVLSYGPAEAQGRASTLMADGSLRLAGSADSMRYAHSLMRDQGFRADISGKGGSLMWILARGGSLGYAGGSVKQSLETLSEHGRQCLGLLMMSLDIAHVMEVSQQRGVVRHGGYEGKGDAVHEVLYVDPGYGYPPATLRISRTTGLVESVSAPGLRCREFAGDTIVIGDYRQTNSGLMLPFLIVAYEAKVKLFEITLRGYALGNPISPSIFQP